MNPELQRVAEALPTGPSSPIWDLDSADSPSASETCPMSEHLHLSSVGSSIGCTTPISHLDKSHVHGLSSSTLLPDPCLGSVADLGEGLHGEGGFFDNGQDSCSFSANQDPSTVHLDSMNSALDSCDDSNDHLKRSESEETYHVPGCDTDILSCVKESCDKSTARLLFPDTPERGRKRMDIPKGVHESSNEQFQHDPSSLEIASASSDCAVTAFPSSSAIQTSSSGSSPGFTLPVLMSQSQNLSPGVVGPCTFTVVNLKIPLMTSTLQSGTETIAGQTIGNQQPLTLPSFMMVPGTNSSLSIAVSGTLSSGSISTTAGTHLCCTDGSQLSSNTLLTNSAGPVPSITPLTATGLFQAQTTASMTDQPSSGNIVSPVTQPLILSRSQCDPLQVFRPVSFEHVGQTATMLRIAKPTPIKTISNFLSNGGSSCDTTHSFPLFHDGEKLTQFTPSDIDSTNNDVYQYINTDSLNITRSSSSLSDTSNRDSSTLSVVNDTVDMVIDPSNALSTDSTLFKGDSNVLPGTLPLPSSDDPMSISLSVRQPDGTLKTLQVMPVGHVVKKVTNSVSKATCSNVSNPTSHLPDTVSVTGTYMPLISDVDSALLSQKPSGILQDSTKLSNKVSVTGTYIPVIGDVDSASILDKTSGISENSANLSANTVSVTGTFIPMIDDVDSAINKNVVISENATDTVTIASPYTPMISDVITNYIGNKTSISSLVQLVTPPRAPHTFKCDLCSATFNRLGNYTRHRMIHTVHVKDDYRYKCDKCERMFLQKCDLKRHKLIHANQEPYQCPVCLKGYVRNSDLQVHMRFHNREKTFNCSYCNKSFYQSGDLNRHVRKSHFQTKMLTCGHCDKPYGYAKEATLIRHMQTKHKDIILQSLKQKLGTSMDSADMADGSPKDDSKDGDGESPEGKAEVSAKADEDAAGPSSSNHPSFSDHVSSPPVNFQSYFKSFANTPPSFQPMGKFKKI